MKTLSGLNNILLVITNKCNLSCEYCYMSNEPNYMDFNLTKKIIDNTDDNSNIEFFGGEPLLNADVVEQTLDYIKQQNRKLRSVIITNGTIFNDQVKRILTNHQCGIGISFDGINNFIRTHNKETDKLILQNIKDISDFLKRDIGVKISITPQNVHTLLDNVKWLYEEQNIKYLSHFLLRDDGWTPETVQTLREQLRLLIPYNKKHFNDGLRNDFLNIFIDQYKRSYGCWAGKHGVGIDYKGDIYPCQRFLTNQQFKLGTVDTGIKNELFKYYDSKNFVGCQKCKIYDRCNDFCIASQLETNGTMFLPINNVCDAVRACREEIEVILNDSEHLKMLKSTYQNTYKKR